MACRLLVARTLLAFACLAAAPFASAQDACANRGDLDQQYCDANKDLVADVPTDPKKLKNPSTIVFTYTPVEDPAVYEKIFDPFVKHLAQCTDKKVVFFQVWETPEERLIGTTEILRQLAKLAESKKAA